MNITQQNSPNHWDGRKGWKPDMIVCHITDGSYGGAVDWLCNPQSQASAHFVVSRAGEVTQLVDLQDGAWCNGTSSTPSSAYYTDKSTLAAVRSRGVNANYYTISIEHEGMYSQTHGALTEAQQAATVALIRYIRSEVQRIYGITIPIDRQHIVGHCEIAPQAKPTCPGEKFPFDAIIKALGGTVTQTASVSVHTAAAPSPTASSDNANIRTAQQWYNARGAGIAVDGIWGAATRKAATASVQRGCNQAYGSGLVIDGIWGPATAAVVRTLRSGSSNAAVYSLQAALMAHGYSIGNSGMDGKFGAGTEQAVRAYQRVAGLTADGLAGKATFAALCQ
ncbi:N-acetylmuramoyl-L-alanine amidase [Caproicibacterium sp. XB1]|uniref:peptidoglycan recognition protein family protein n=1 Tax=Caproicibacterium sp. XB1 TaxID=3396405 RepID=UPI0039B6FDD8